MKATGIVRRIDELGRVVIPKEIRRTMRIREGDPLEIFTDREGELIFKKYSPAKEISDFAEKIAESVSESSGLPVIITDKEVIIAVSGASKKDYIDLAVSENLENVMNARHPVLLKDNGVIPLKNNDAAAYTSQAAAPILAAGDIYGCVIVFSKEKENPDFGPAAFALAKTAAAITGAQIV